MVEAYDLRAIQRIESFLGLPTSNGCLEWCGALNGNGYGRMHYRGRAEYPHRVVYRLFVGPLHAREVLVDHACGNRLCVNPQHLRGANDHTNGQHRVQINKNNTSGYPGVIREGRKWRAQTMVRRQHVVIGRAESAREAYLLWVAWQRANNLHADPRLLAL